MKAILVIDMPTSCRDCPCGDYNICAVLKKTHTDKMSEQREDWCPLKPMPSKRKNPITKTFGTPFNKGKVIGWNDCLEEIENGN